MAEKEKKKRKYNYTKKTGRPTKYDEKLCKSLVNFFTVEPTRKLKDTFTSKDGVISEKEREAPNCIPFFGAWCRSVGISQDTLNEWKKIHPKFSEAYKTAKELQKEILIENGLKGLYNNTFAIFTAKCITDMDDRSSAAPPTELSSLEDYKQLLQEVEQLKNDLGISEAKDFKE